MELLGVGDRAFSIFTGDAKPPGASTASAPLSDHVDGGTKAGAASQWEGLAADGLGRAFVLQEHPGDESQPSHVFVLAPDFDERVAVIALAVGDDGSNWKRAWRKHENARGEALVLLRDARLLVAKQKDPVRFIEFGPPGARPAGLGASRFLGNESFELPSEPFLEFEPLCSWGLAKRDRDELRTVNDLAAFDGRLYAISRESRLIARLEASVRPDEGSVGIECSWSVPTAIRNPEGLVVLDGLLPIVADDLSGDEDTGGPNIFLLSDLGADRATFADR